MKINISSIIQAKTIDKAIGGSISGGGLKPTSVTIKSTPTKTKYAQGEALDITGLKVEAIVGELSGDVTADVTTVPANGTILTNQTKIDVKYGGITESIPIEVVTISDIEVTSNPTVTNYFIGSQLDLSGIVVTGTYSDGSTANITNLCTFTPASGAVLDKLGQNDIIVSYNGLSDSISVSVYEADSISVTKQPTKTTYKTDEPLDFTGLIVTASNSEVGISADVTSACTFSPVEGTVLDEEKTYTISVSYGSLSTSFDVVCQNLPTWDSRGLNYNSWETIQTYIKEGLFSTVASVGQTKSFVAGGKTYNAEVVSINDGTGSAGQWYPNKTVDFITKESYSKHNYNDGDTNAGGFPSSALNIWLNNTVYNNLPTDLKSVIINKSHSYISGSSGSMATASTKLWLPTRYELANNTDRQAQGETESNNKKYIISSNVKYLDGTVMPWWTATRDSLYSNGFWRLDSSGRLGSEYASYQYGVPICFRVG